MPLRRAIGRGDARWVRRLPTPIRHRLDLDGGAIDPLRIEIGGGEYPAEGYIHVDANWRSRHLEYVAQADELPFDDESAEEIRAVHVLEHVHPSNVDKTLREWRRVLRPGGFAQIHVPNAATLFPAFLESSPEQKWALMSGVFGMTCAPWLEDLRGLEYQRHEAVYDLGLLEAVLASAGFDRVDDVSDEVTDRHAEAWRDLGLVERVSLIVRAFPARTE